MALLPTWAPWDVQLLWELRGQEVSTPGHTPPVGPWLLPGGLKLMRWPGAARGVAGCRVGFKRA